MDQAASQIQAIAGIYFNIKKKITKLKSIFNLILINIEINKMVKKNNIAFILLYHKISMIKS